MNEEYFSNGFFNLEIAKGFGTHAICHLQPIPLGRFHQESVE